VAAEEAALWVSLVHGDIDEHGGYPPWYFVQSILDKRLRFWACIYIPAQLPVGGVKCEDPARGGVSLFLLLLLYRVEGNSSALFREKISTVDGVTCGVFGGVRGLTRLRTGIAAQGVEHQTDRTSRSQPQAPAAEEPMHSSHDVFKLSKFRLAG
jgi:hypothetical protein